MEVYTPSFNKIRTLLESSLLKYIGFNIEVNSNDINKYVMELKKNQEKDLKDFKLIDFNCFLISVGVLTFLDLNNIDFNSGFPSHTDLYKLVIPFNPAPRPIPVRPWTPPRAPRSACR